jgi:hypothetical protein
MLDTAREHQAKIIDVMREMPGSVAVATRRQGKQLHRAASNQTP